MGDLICISHLRWNFVWQRPQHLLARLSKQYRILFVEEPVLRQETGAPYLEIEPAQDAPNVTVVRLVQPAEEEVWVGHGDSRTQATYSRLLRRFLAEENYQCPLLWLYTPMALDFAGQIEHSVLVYDVMDQLSAFAGAPAGLEERENQLLQRADLVFTGGASLYRAKRPSNPQTYLFPSGVEIEHFARASQGALLPRPADLANVSSPILGYYGVIDERMDFGLLHYLAQAEPDWDILLIGPTAKIEARDLPQAPNLHYLGKKSYQELPLYLSYFDVALVPFAHNEATRYLSPTKTLEYMAAHKPVVSTAINDVIELYGEVVRVANTPARFVEYCQSALIENPANRCQREEQILARYTWDKIAQEMHQLILDRQTFTTYYNDPAVLGL